MPWITPILKLIVTLFIKFFAIMEVIPPKKNWFQRNWPWVIPLGGCLTLVIVISFFIGSAYYSAKSFFTDFTEQITETIPIDEAMQRVVDYKYLNEVLGSPIEAQESSNTNMEILNGATRHSTQTKIVGTKGSAILYLVGDKKGEEWHYSEMYVVIDETGEEVDLFFDGE